MGLSPLIRVQNIQLKACSIAHKIFGSGVSDCLEGSAGVEESRIVVRVHVKVIGKRVPICQNSGRDQSVIEWLDAVWRPASSIHSLATLGHHPAAYFGDLAGMALEPVSVV